MCALKTSIRCTHALHTWLPASFWQCPLHEQSSGTHSGYFWDQASSNLQGSGHQWISKKSGRHQATLTCGNVREYPPHTRNTFKSDPGKETHFLVPHCPAAWEYVSFLFLLVFRRQVLNPSFLPLRRDRVASQIMNLDSMWKSYPHHFCSPPSTQITSIFQSLMPQTQHSIAGDASTVTNLTFLSCPTLAKILKNYIWYSHYNLTLLNGVRQCHTFSVVGKPIPCRLSHISLPVLPYSLPSLQVCLNCFWGSVSCLTRITNCFPKECLFSVLF